MLQIPPQKLKELLVKQDLIAPQLFDDLVLEAERMKQNLGDILISRGIISYSYFYTVLANYLGVEKTDLATRSIDEKILKLLDEETARRKKLILFAKQPDGVLSVAMEDPSDLEAIEFLEKRLNLKIKPYLATQEDLDRGFALYGQQLVENFKKIVEENISVSLKARVKNIKEAAAQVPIVAIVDNLLSYAISLRASDIHIEILEDVILIRFRIDGVLHEIIRIPKEIHPAITARIKLLGGLKIDEHMKPQDGRFRYKIGSDLIDIRVAIMPIFYGEKIEMRLLSSTQKPLSFEELGMFEDVVKIVEENIKKSYGMVLICGPTGSGKSTTLYSILNILNKPEVNIVTIEDPIEFDIKYVNQTQINNLAGITFANGLRAILRQDPNIIMVGEIRDEETAEIAVHSALTGHLLLSSLHTNDAVTAIPRFIDMKIASFLVAAVLNMVLAQRLVRKICLDCIESFSPDAEMIKSLEKQFKELKIESGISVPKILYRGRGCPACSDTGYRGRFGIFEVLSVDENIRKVIIDTNFSLDTLKEAARKQGMITMFEDSLKKVARGLTTIEEVLRVIRE
ncbi:MAG TPA: type II/IV secretion system protein [Candidatus Wolfebacteria bacterium]|nr:type II/IV secretion system protein [Candidatus Wolfebacteria bacterium]